MINLDDDKEDFPVFDNIIADGKRQWEVVKIHPIKDYYFNSRQNILLRPICE